MKCIITGNSAVLVGPFEVSFVGVIASLNGKKKWLSSATLQFEAITSNIKKLQNCGRDIEFVDESGLLAEIEEFENLPTQIAQIDAVKTDYRPKMKLRSYQQKAVHLSAERKAYAYFFEQGLGKTATCITNIGILTLANKLTGVLIFAPKGVHEQWCEKQFPSHFDNRISVKFHIWNGKPFVIKRGNEALSVLAMNVDSMRTKPGFEMARDFLKSHSGSSMMVLDESHLIKSVEPIAKRTKAAWALGKMATYRRILTGTPISKNVGDFWSQFQFLDERILGHKYFTSFKARYCVLGGFEGKKIVGSKNIEELYQLIAPHSFRFTKAEDTENSLPPKIPVEKLYEMSDTTAHHYKELKKNFITMLDNGEIVDVKNAISLLIRLQQVLSGFLPNPDGNGYIEISEDRMYQLMDIINQTEGPTVIWSRFTEDVQKITTKLNSEFGEGSAVCYYGGNPKEREESKRLFLNKKARFFISNPAAGGTGLELQDSGCQTVVYYSNSFNYIHRAQSEDRTHRIGMTGSVTYFDIIARKSVDSHILRNLQSKKSVSDLTLDDIRKTLI